MNFTLERCVEIDDNRPVVIVKENGKTYTLYNITHQKIKKIKVDGCLPQKANEKRCDYLIILEKSEKQRAIFIELKGGDLVKGIKQLIDTIAWLRPQLVDYTIDARLIGSKSGTNLITSPYYQKLFKLTNSTNGSIKIATNKSLEENI